MTSKMPALSPTKRAPVGGATAGTVAPPSRPRWNRLDDLSVVTRFGPEAGIRVELCNGNGVLRVHSGPIPPEASEAFAAHQRLLLSPDSDHVVGRGLVAGPEAREMFLRAIKLLFPDWEALDAG